MKLNKRNIRKEAIHNKYKKPLKEELKIIYNWGHYDNSRSANQNEVMRTIRHYHKTDQLVDMLEDLYPDGITEGELDDILYYEWEWVYDKLGIPQNATEYDKLNERLVKESVLDTKPHLIISGEMSLYTYEDYELVLSYDKKEYILKRTTGKPIEALIDNFSVEYDNEVESKYYDNMDFIDVELNYITINAYKDYFELEDLVDSTISFRVDLPMENMIDYDNTYFDLDSTCFERKNNYIHNITVDLSNNTNIIDNIIDLY